MQQLSWRADSSLERRRTFFPFGLRNFSFSSILFGLQAGKFSRSLSKTCDPTVIPDGSDLPVSLSDLREKAASFPGLPSIFRVRLSCSL